MIPIIEPTARLIKSSDHRPSLIMFMMIMMMMMSMIHTLVRRESSCHLPRIMMIIIAHSSSRDFCEWRWSWCFIVVFLYWFYFTKWLSLVVSFRLLVEVLFYHEIIWIFGKSFDICWVIQGSLDILFNEVYQLFTNKLDKVHEFGHN